MIANCACFVCGTDTDVGKTVVCGGLLRNMPNTHVLKVIQTGSNLIDQNVYLEVVEKQYVKTLFHFPLAASPHLAAQQTGYALNLADVKKAIQEEVKQHEFTIIEGSGGVMTPITENDTFLDLITLFKYPVLLVVKNILGAINQALLCIHALQNRGVKILGIIINQSIELVLDEELLIAKENIRLIAHKSGLPVVATIPFISHIIGTQERWTQIAKALIGTASILKNSLNNPNKQLIEFDQKHLWHPYETAITATSKPIVEQAFGTRLILNNGQTIIDGTSSWWSAIHGYSHPELVEAIQTQSEKLSHVMFGGLTHKPAITLGEKLLSIVPRGLEHIFYSDSGSVAIEIALKMATQYWYSKKKPNKFKFISFYGGYHGDTYGAASVSDPNNIMHSKASLTQNIFAPKPSISFYESFDELSVQSLRHTVQRHCHECSALIIEPILQGAGGMWLYHPNYLKQIRQLCDEYELLFIVDEIATGFGRTGKLFASEWADIVPDIMCIGKALTGGMLTLAATLTTPKVATGISALGHPLMHGPTYMANPLACHVATTSINLLLKNTWQDNVLKIEQWLKEGMQNYLSYPEVQAVRVLGAMGAVALKHPVNVVRLQNYFIEQGVWIRPFKNIIYVMPTYTASVDEIACLTHAIEGAIKGKVWV